MDSSFVKAIQDGKEVKVIEIDDRKYSTASLVPVEDPIASPIKTTTLSGIVDFLKMNRDGAVPADCFVHVQNPRQVTVTTKIVGKFRKRENLIEATYGLPTFEFGKYKDMDTFITQLQALFVENQPLIDIVAFVSSISQVGSVGVDDDGISQEVTRKVGITRKEKSPVKNPIVLTPRRIFPEAKQVASPFILRVKGSEDEIEAALFEADGGQWQVDAALNIKEFLDEQLNGKPNEQDKDGNTSSWKIIV
ncbi:hypothetical protein EHO57_14105 [Leptospira langatensis]|uniref:Uncharacterized protein n=1 Tax=Leptospira langatensis TaxID=2484983 RepID=A0A5R2ASV1_9LEPT|nr:hypothetical protein [Leptospira langatensis]TGJ99888.1 hypothetical protein EHO57_14105 [Leptospira langatensis]